MIIESGLIIFLGLLFLAVKLPKRSLLLMLGKPLYVDLGVSVLVYVLHWGTFSGVMAAAVAGLMTSIATSAGRWLWGYIVKVDGREKYFPGKVHIEISSLRKTQ